MFLPNVPPAVPVFSGPLVVKSQRLGWPNEVGLGADRVYKTNVYTTVHGIAIISFGTEAGTTAQ